MFPGGGPVLSSRRDGDKRPGVIVREDGQSEGLHLPSPLAPLSLRLFLELPGWGMGGRVNTNGWAGCGILQVATVSHSIAH